MSRVLKEGCEDVCASGTIAPKLMESTKKGKEKNNERSLLIERGSFTPLVMLHLEIKQMWFSTRQKK